MQFKIIYEDANILAVDKPNGIVVFPEGKVKGKTLIELLLEQFPDLKNAGSAPRYGIVHRLDKDTSGIILVAKNTETLLFLQKQFKTGSIQKKYIALAVGDIKNNQGIIETLIGRSPSDGKKQKVYLNNESRTQDKRQAVTQYEVKERFENYTLLEIFPKTGRKHQIRCHLAYIGHPLAGDKLYGFKNQPLPENLKRHFLHATYLKIKLQNSTEKEIISEIPDDLQKIINQLKPI